MAKKGKNKIVFDEEDRKNFLKAAGKSKYTKREKELYKKKNQIKESKRQQKEKYQVYKDSIEERYKQISKHMRENNHYLSDSDDDDDEDEEDKNTKKTEINLKEKDKKQEK